MISCIVQQIFTKDDPEGLLPISITSSFRVLCIVLVVSLCTGFLNAQDRTEFVDEFNTNGNGWMVESNESHVFEIVNGQYSLDKTKGESAYLVWTKVPLDEKRDWVIEAKIKHISGSQEHGYGLIFNADDASHYSSLLISANGYAEAIDYYGSDFSKIFDWRKSPNVKPSGEWNVLSIKHIGDLTSFYVNDVCVGSMTSSDFHVHGNRIGFIVYNTMKIVVDRIVVRSSPGNHPVKSVQGSNVTAQRVNLGPHVNSTSTELTPIVSADGKTLYFCRRGYSGNIGVEHRDDVWFCQKDSNNVWEEAKNLGRPINNEGYNSVISVTPDNNTLILQNTYNSDGSLKGAGLSISHRTDKGWELPKEIMIDSSYNLNEYQEQCLSPDAKVLVMSIEQYDTRGSKDLYVSFRTSDTSFSQPKRIAELATPGQDMAPFIASDGLTMYYSTNGLPGYGSQDIFMARRLDSTWMHWTDPVNLGTAVNTNSFDAYFRTTAKGDSAYMITYSDTYGGGDIVRIAVPPAAQPLKVCLISGHVYDSKTKKPLAAGVVYEMLANSTEAGIARSSPTDGAYSIVLPVGNLYGFRAEAPGYYSVSEQLDTRSLESYKEITRDLYLVPIEKDATIRLNNLFFDFAKYELRPESSSELDRLIQFLRSNPNIKISILGHTDNVGDEKRNVSLSMNRAQAVMQYLATHGIEAGRMTSKGFGKSKPIESNETEDGRQKNRRVEFMITAK